MKCKLIEEKLIFYIENELNMEETAQVRVHLDDCPKCQYLCSQLEQSLSIINEDKLVESNPYFHTRIMERIKIQEEKKSIFGWIIQKQLILRMSVYIVLISLAFIAGRYLGSDNSATDTAITINQTDTTDYQMFANSYDYHYNQNAYIIESTNKVE